jgi:hypothetical protein
MSNNPQFIHAASHLSKRKGPAEPALAVSFLTSRPDHARLDCLIDNRAAGKNRVIPAGFITGICGLLSLR